MTPMTLTQAQDFVAKYAPDGTVFVDRHAYGPVKSGKESYYVKKYRAMEQDYLPTLCQLIEGMKPGWVVDIGPGWGTMTVWLASRGWHVTAMDFVKFGTHLTNMFMYRLRKQTGADVAYLQRDIFNDPIALGADLVLMSQVILHLKWRPDIAVRNAGMMLAPGGTFICTALDPACYPTVKPAYGFDWRDAPEPGAGEPTADPVTLMLDRGMFESLLSVSLGPCEVWRPEGSTCLFGKYQRPAVVRE